MLMRLSEEESLLPAHRVRRSMFLTVSVAVALCFVVNDDSVAQSPPSKRDLFENHVRPMIVKHCLQCHGETKQEGSLNLTTLDGLLTGGESGPAIVSGAPDESLLLEALRYESYEMPPSGQLDESLIEGVHQWIESGADWPEGVALKATEKITSDDRDWWCYQPIDDPAVPDVNDEGWCRNEIDHFIFDRLQREGLEPSDSASAKQLARRLHFAITGLPPSSEVASVIEEESDWYERLVNQLLNSKAYGENQARFWLDLVRYADSDGYNADHKRPNAYLYRDYVIQSFNEDKPYDRFVEEQIAGDEVDPGNRNALIGTMYLRHWIYEHNQRDVEGQWAQILSDVTETTSDVFLAQGIKCARCHDHKFDPLLQRDYYALRAFFTPLKPREDMQIGDVETKARYLEHQRIWEEATDAIRQQIHEIETPVLLAHSTREGVHRFTKEIQAMVASRRHELSPYENQIATLASKQFDVLPEKLPEWLEEETETKRQELRKQLAEFDHLKPEPLTTLPFVISDVGPTSPETTIPDDPTSTPIDPGVPLVLEENPATIEPLHPALQSTGRRRALAEWIVDEKNPLTARVIVNRIWEQHFGRGLVETTSDFGHLGTPPSHPELLDWLARRFMEDGWSLKALHRRILTSATYRQSSERQMDDRTASFDPQNVLLWRMNPRRLSGEEIHDTVMCACEQMGDSDRAIYEPVLRNSLDPLLAAFDFPDRVESQCKRHQTTTSPQSLLMMNSAWLHERAEMMESNIGESNLESFIATAYERLFFRDADRDELADAKTFVEQYAENVANSDRKSPVEPFPSGSSALRFSTKSPGTMRTGKIPQLTDSESNGQLTIEATVLLDSLYPDASVRTIVANWTGKQSDRGWSLGVTSTKSRYQPRNLILQLVGSKEEGESKPTYEVIPSNLRLKLDTPYYIAVTINFRDKTETGIHFYLQDLSNPEQSADEANAAHQATWNVQSDRPVEIGGRSGSHLWDGLIQNVRVHNAVVQRSDLFGSDSESAHRIVDLRFDAVDQPGADVSGNGYHASVDGLNLASPMKRARTALLHALLCSNEVIYVD
ncbi:Planctomycete cytochrome C [Thalassoglobus neptunius]|uniref:Planctomycete cytochrome C n=1 Tax=Thalassoglobus neptunius TaxID=1938619 RepID=A0A5C5VPY7_9PLAN|nr:DUF1553 domain-containing protein [Thalassoglobus neptunius]TWT40708.1 Planctomycete cytochrome C [Thalassoglobus neptunius]